MKNRLSAILIAAAIFAVAAVSGRMLLGSPQHVAPRVARANGSEARLAANAQSPGAATEQSGLSAFDECMDEAVQRRVDPIVARHTCGVIADNL